MAGGNSHPCYCNFTYCALFLSGWECWGRRRPSAVVVSPGLLRRPLLHGLLPLRGPPAFLFPNTNICWALPSEKRPAGSSFFPTRIPLLSYNICIVPKFAGFVSPFPRSRFYVALQRARV
jgi:hypothetical protein